MDRGLILAPLLATACPKQADLPNLPGSVVEEASPRVENTPGLELLLQAFQLDMQCGGLVLDERPGGQSSDGVRSTWVFETERPVGLSTCIERHSPTCEHSLTGSGKGVEVSMLEVTCP